MHKICEKMKWSIFSFYDEKVVDWNSIIFQFGVFSLGCPIFLFGSNNFVPCYFKSPFSCFCFYVAALGCLTAYWQSATYFHQNFISKNEVSAYVVVYPTAILNFLSLFPNWLSGCSSNSNTRSVRNWILVSPVVLIQEVSE